MNPKAKTASLRPTSGDAWDFCITTEHEASIKIELSLSQILSLGEQCNRIIYSKFAGLKKL